MGDPADELPLEPIPPMSPKQKRVLKWQRFYNAAVKGTGLPALEEDGRRGPKTNEAMKTVRMSGAQNLRQFSQMASKLKPRSLTEMRTKMMQSKRKEQMTGQKQPPAAPAAPAAPLGRAGIRKVYRNLTDALQKKYPRVDLYTPQWSGVRELLWERAQGFSSADVPAQVQQMMSELDIDKMKQLRRGLAPPAMPKPRMSR